MIYVRDADLTIHQGDCRQVLRELPDESVDCVATSPPFFGLRDYGTGSWDGGDPDCDHRMPPQGGIKNSTLNAKRDPETGWLAEDRKAQPHRPTYSGICAKCGARRVDQQIGLEATPDLWVAELVAVFRECRRVLRPHGTLWIECGDGYTTGAGGYDGAEHRPIDGETRTTGKGLAAKKRARVSGSKPKDLIGSPFLLAFALRADGWWLRQAIIWHKPNAMPESVMDRCTTAHSYVFLLSKSPRYWFDADAIAEVCSPTSHGSPNINRGSKAEALGNGKGATTLGRWTAEDAASGRHPRSVWTIPTRGYPGAHFATWPEALAERIVKAGCPEWVCGTCWKPRERITERESFISRPTTGRDTQKQKLNPETSMGLGRVGGHVAVRSETVGWSDCGHDNYRPGVILDPFGGAGTTGLVARRHGRHGILIELNADYCRMASERTQQLSVLAEETL